MKKICIIDYGLGNIRSLYNSIKKIGFVPTFYSERKNENFDLIFIIFVLLILLLKISRTPSTLSVHRSLSTTTLSSSSSSIVFDRKFNKE